MQTSCGPAFGGMFTRCYCKSMGSFLENFKEHCTSFTCKVHLVPHFEECLLGVIIKCDR